MHSSEPTGEHTPGESIPCLHLEKSLRPAQSQKYFWSARGSSVQGPNKFRLSQRKAPL